MEVLIALLINLLIPALFGVVCAVIAQSRGRSAVGWFFIGLIGGCIALIVLLVLPDLEVERQKYERLRRENLRLRERAKKDRQVADARHSQLEGRITAHDRALGLDTSQRDALPGAAPDLLPELTGAGSDASAHATHDWYYVLEGDSKGPVKFGELKILRREGFIAERTLLWYDGLGDWTPLGEIPGLGEALHG